MSRSSVKRIVVWLLALITGLALLLNLPDKTAFNQYSGDALIYTVLTAFSLYFGVLLSVGELSTAHTIGMVAFLSLPPDAQPVMLWATFIGGLAGGALLTVRSGDAPRRLTPRSLSGIVIVSARVTLSFLAAGEIYLLLGGRTPLGIPVLDSFVPLTAYMFGYCLLYLAIFLLETYCDGRSVARLLRENLPLLLAILILPTPFTVISALMIPATRTAFPIYIAGTGMVVFGLYFVSRAQRRLHQQLSNLRALGELSQAFQSSIDLQTVLRLVYQQVSRRLPSDSFVVALYDAGELRFPLVEPASARAGVAEGLLSFVLKRGEPLLLSGDVAGRARELGVEAPPGEVVSWLGVPLRAGGRLIGGLAVASTDPEYILTQDDLRLLNIIAANASVAIDNAQLYEQQTARIGHLSTLNKVLSVLTGTLSPDDVLDAIISSASVISEATAVAVYLYRDDTQHGLALIRSAGMSDRFSDQPPQPLITHPQQKPVFIADVDDDARAAAYRNFMKSEGKAAWAELPLAVGENSLGTLVFYFNEPQVFSEERLEILRTFTHQAAQAIKNARQYTTTDKALERRAEQMYALAQLGRQLTAIMNLKSICSLVLSRALEFSGASAGFVVIRNGPNGDLMLGAYSGYPPALSLTPAGIEHSLTGQALRSGIPLRWNDTSSSREGSPLLSQTRSQLSVPIVRGGSVQGAITLESDRLAAFSEDDSHFTSQLANQAVIAVENSRLFESITENRDRLQVILNAMTEAIVLIDQSGHIALANPRVDLLNLSQDALLSRDIESLLADETLHLAAHMGFASSQDVQSLLEAMRAPGEWRGAEPVSYTLENENGIIYLQRHILPVQGEDGKRVGVLLVFYDETEERELAQARQDLSSMIVHDLRSPLTAVTTGLKLLRDLVPPGNPLRPPVESTVDTSQRAIRKLLSRVDSLLDISRMESGQLNLEKEPTDLATLVDNVCLELSPLAHELEVTLTSEVDDHFPPLNVDRDKVERLLQNLVDNALKYVPMDGLVTIRAHRPGTHQAAAGFARIDVVDTGPGIPDDYKARLFDRFVQVKGRRGARRGIGLGLTFCKMVVEAHSGDIWIEDNPAGGSIFSFTLPVAVLSRFDETDEWDQVGELP
jgi:signal transduction histidine kinase/putative methionine-R-sulfoxide reductase with GAF domain